MPKQVDHAARRRELVEASWDVIARDGIEGITLRKVAAAADCTTGRIAHYFSGRDELILSALRAAHTRAGKRMVEIANTDPNAVERLRRVIREALPLDAKRLQEWKVWIVFWNAAAANRDLAKENERRYNEWEALLTRLIAQISGQRGAAAHAITLMALIDGLGIRASLAPTAKTRRLVQNSIDRWLLDLTR
ncbi:MAG: TetR family transcriptional regulator C-terminal domain-containing protein [Gammaproteobacteria bacterium]|nr:TetR family transcriptional regulator C-terminal domain-containing protein [Gammaproteobacteria bacterium]